MKTITLDIKRKMLRMVLLVAVPLLAVSCSMMHEDYEPMPDMLGDSYVSVTVSAGSREATTRGPQGGEDGDGREDARENEYKISNLTLLLYKGGNNGINSDNNPTIEHAIYFSSFNVADNGTGGYDNKTYSTFTKKLDDGIERAEYHVIAIANAGDKTSLKGQYLSDVRDHIITEQWKTAASINDYTDFVMTSEEDATIDMTTGDGSFDNPFEATIDVERLAARIDFDITEVPYHSEDGGYYEYDVDGTDKYRLKSIKVKNMLTSGSYLIKRVATAVDGTGLSYLGAETAESNVSTNYVLDPWTCSKTSTDKPDGLSYSDSDIISVKGEVREIDGEKFFTLAYAQENTLPNAENKATYATALEFTGEYISNGTSKGESKVTYYIRHCDPNDNAAETSPMKYGIVRNN
ncbi:MAG: hypothetical protein IKB96_01510, partial [Prevotella sp.]|nr:hypothetical protein [Prevotella sp.]